MIYSSIRLLFHIAKCLTILCTVNPCVGEQAQKKLYQDFNEIAEDFNNENFSS